MQAAAMTLAGRPSIAEVWDWLGQVPDPEIPAVSVVDLGIVRDVCWQPSAGKDEDELVVTITPTYSGCPATTVIALEIEAALRGKGISSVRLKRQISPAWTTDWISQSGRGRLLAYGIVPPAEKAGGLSPLDRVLGRKPAVVIACPRCRSHDTVKVSAFGSTPCKAQHRCQSCLEPFDYFKCL